MWILRPVHVFARRPLLCLSWLAIVLALATSTATAGGDISAKKGIPIHVRDYLGLPHVGEPVTFAVPLAASDKITKTKQLIVLGPDGKPVPSQLKVQTRWNAAPDDKKAAIRWVLVDLQVDLDANQAEVYTLRKKKKKDKSAKTPKLKAKLKGGVCSINTGAARFVLSSDRANFLDQVAVDLNGDGKTSSDELLINEPTDAGFFLLDRFGSEYSSLYHDVTYTIEEKGPMRVVVRADGRHSPPTPDDGIGRDFFQYRTRYMFYAGKPFVRVQHTLRNAYLMDPLGRIGFEGYRLRLSVEDAAFDDPSYASFRMQDGSTVDIAGPSRIYQDSDGGAWWADSPGTTFPGYFLYAGDTIQQGGGQAPGVMSVSDGARGVTVAMRWFFEQFPKGMAHTPGGIDFHIFPEQFSTFHWLDDGQQITTEFLVYPHGAEGQDSTVIDSYLQPLRPFAEPEWVRSSGAWGDQGDLAQPTKSSSQLTAHGQSTVNSIYSSAYKKTGYDFGWSEFGEQTTAKSTHTTGSPRNKLTYFDRFAVNGSWWEFRYRELFAVHSRDIRPYHIDGFRHDDFPNVTLWEGMPSSTSVNKLNRDNLDPELDPHRADIHWAGHGWNGFDFEHMSNDDLFEYYLLSGDLVSLDSLKEMGEALKTFPTYKPDKAPGSTRGIGWTLRALLKIYQVTGDNQILDTADRLVTSLENSYNKNSISPINGIKYHWVTRYPPNGSHVADADYDCPWQIAVTIHGLLMFHRETGQGRAVKIAEDLADYIVDYGWNGVAMNDSMAVDDHTNNKYFSNNTGVNTWIPSALALVYAKKARPEYLAYATLMYDSLSSSFKDETHYLGSGLFMWWHNYRVLIGQ